MRRLLRRLIHSETRGRTSVGKAAPLVGVLGVLAHVLWEALAHRGLDVPVEVREWLVGVAAQLLQGALGEAPWLAVLAALWGVRDRQDVEVAQ